MLNLILERGILKDNPYNILENYNKMIKIMMEEEVNSEWDKCIA